MDEKWRDIEHIDEYKEYFEFNDYVVVVEDEDGDVYTDIVFSIAMFPKGVQRFFCVPYDED